MIERDLVGEWFAAVASIGEDASIRFARFATPESEPDWLYQPHSRSDGIGAFVDLLRKNGHPQLQKLPRQRGKLDPSVCAIFGTWIRFLFSTRPRYRWGPMSKCGATRVPPLAAAAIVLNKGMRSRRL